MSMRDKMKGIFQIDGGDDEFYDDDEGYLDEPEPMFKKASRDADDGEESDSIAKRVPRISKTSRKSMGNGMEVCVVKPTAFEDAREITETLLANRTVVLNLEGLDVDIAQRIIDFSSGSCFAMRGNLQKISHYIFIITPPSVDISGDFQDLITGTLDVEISR
ncbi:MAG: cell division protein SepF [Lachnospiraceae bacterium]|nr:cell division protein SepF [Lachnospiraceae bacterium]